MTDHDQLSRFLLPAAGVRGVHVRLTKAWDDIQGAAEYPPAARQLLGEAAVAAALFTGHSKVHGRLSLQLRGNDTLRTLFAECTAAGTLRGIVQLADGVDAPTDLRELGDAALLAITIENPGLDPREPQRYQSLVGMQAPDLAEAFETYFQQSEQLPTRLLLAAGPDQAAGLLLQKLPGDEGDNDGWTRIGALFDTLGATELLSVAGQDLLHRLFHEEEHSCSAASRSASAAPARVSGSPRCCNRWARKRRARPPRPLAKSRCAANSVAVSITFR